jgi:hypothetical protein
MSDTDEDFDLDEYERKYSGGEITGPLLAEVKRLRAENGDDYDALKKHIAQLVQEIKRLREGIQNALYLFQEAGNPKMSDKKRLDTICDALLEVIE